MDQIKLSETKPVTIIIIALIFSVAFIPLMNNILVKNLPYNLWLLFYSRLIIWATLLIMYVYAIKVEGRQFLIWEQEDYPVWFYFSSLCILFIADYVIRIIAAIPMAFGWHENFAVMYKFKVLVRSSSALYIFSIVTAGVTEELIMRGYVLTRLSLLFKDNYMPVIISSAMFAALHYGYHSLFEIIFTFLFGVVTAVYYQKYRNLHVLIIFHILVDLIAFA